MSDLVQTLSQFHFIRPWLLVPIPIALFVWWRIRSISAAGEKLPAGLAPHLAEALRVNASRNRRVQAIDGVTLAITLFAAAAAGPAWNRIPNPLLAQTAPLAVVLEVTDSMESRDIAPSRLERAKHKIRDVLETRAGARTALIAFAGTAHNVAPLSEDPEVLMPFLDGLSAEVMPSRGNNATAALDLARAALEAETMPGAILFVVDGIDRADIPAMRSHGEKDGDPILVLNVSNDKTALDDLSGLDGITGIAVARDRSDVDAIERRIASAYRAALAADERQMWEDMGWILAWPASLLGLLWFRRGWTMRWGLVLAAFLFVPAGTPARADGLIDWFFTPDQQGRLAYQDKDYAAAADRFEDPAWRGHAFYKAGKYEEATEIFARLDTPEAAFSEGMAHIKSRGYRKAVAAFETALERNPGFAEAARNLEIARAIVLYVERAREQSDTGEEAGIGADDIVFDNESGRGQETQIREVKDVQPQTAQQWMRTVDTRTSDFLRSRFALEAARRRP